MKLIIQITLATILLMTTSCEQEVEPDEILKFIGTLEQDDPIALAANGSKTVVRVLIIPEAGSDFRKVAFRTSAGQFDGQENGELIKEAVYYQDSLVATATLIAPSTASVATVSAEVVIPDERGNYEILRTIEFDSVPPTDYSISADAFNVENDFGSEINVTVKVTGPGGVNASAGLPLLYQDFYAGTTDTVGGYFRNKIEATNANSQGSFTYTPGFIDSEEFIDLFAYVLNSDGDTLFTPKSIRIAVTEKSN